MQLVFRTLSLNAPQCTDRLLALFFLFTNTKNEKHAQGCPLVAGQVIAPLTAEHWGGAGVNEPVHWADLFTDPYRLHTQRKHTAQTRLLSRQQKQLIHVFVLSHFPLAWAQSAPDSICGAALLLCFQPWKLYEYLLAQEPLHQAKAINTRKKAKESHLTHLAIIMIIMWWYNI